MSEKKKRGIVVPVMALAVCAVAMVGLGFALETTVTSDNNPVESMMIDISSSQLTGAEPSPNTVDQLLTIGLVTEKDTITGENGTTNTVVTKKVDGGKAFLKVYGNVEDIMLKVKVTGLTESGEESDPKITSIKLSLFSIEESSLNELGSASVSSNGEYASFEKNDDNMKITSDTDYIIAITGVNEFNIHYSVVPGTESISLNSVTGSWDGTSSDLPLDVSIGYTFQATEWAAKNNN